MQKIELKQDNPIKIPETLLVINLLLINGFFGLIDNEALRFGGFKLSDLAIFGTIFCMLLLICLANTRFFASHFFYILVLWVLYIIFNATVQSMLNYQVEFQYVFRSLRLFLYLGSFFLVFYYNDIQSIHHMISIIIWFDFIASVFFSVQFVMGRQIIAGYYMQTFRIGGLSFFRGYSGQPMMYIFDIIYLFFLTPKDSHLIKFKFNIIMGISICFALLVTFTRGLYLVVIVSTLYYVFGYVSKRKSNGFFISLIAVIIVVSLLLSPIGSSFVEYTKKDLSNPQNSNVFLRIRVLTERFNYIKDNNELLLGIGPRSDSDPNNTIHFHEGAPSQRGIFTGDIGLATLLLQYGIIGSVLYLGLFVSAILIRNIGKNRIIIAIKLQLIAYLFLFFDCSNLLDENYLIRCGLFLGIILKHYQLKVRQSTGINPFKENITKSNTIIGTPL